MLEKVKNIYSRAKNLGFYLTVVGLLITSTVIVDTIYEIVNYNYKQKIPTIATALVLIAALAA